MTTQSQKTVAQKLAKMILCALVILMTLPGVTIISLASVIVWFYGEELLEGQVMKHFKFIEEFLPAIMMKKLTK